MLALNMKALPAGWAGGAHFFPQIGSRVMAAPHQTRTRRAGDANPAARDFFEDEMQKDTDDASFSTHRHRTQA